MGKGTLALYGHIGDLPLKPHRKFAMIRALRHCVEKLRHPEQLAEDAPYTLVMSSGGYGNAYWMKNYCGYKDDLFAQIEHGVYFGENTSPLVNPVHTEYEIGSIITYGPYRRCCIERDYENVCVYEVGPYIQYAPRDEEYYRQIRASLDESQRTLTLFPAHSLVGEKQLFDHAQLRADVRRFAAEHAFGNLVVCISPMDFSSSLKQEYKADGFLPVTCGRSTKTFLPRQRAIFEASDATISNDLGTHIGYSLTFAKPHAMIDPLSFEDKIVAPGAHREAMRAEVELLQRLFASDGFTGMVSRDQRQAFNYYWGGDIKLSPDDMREVFVQCKETYMGGAQPSYRPTDASVVAA